MSNKFFIINIVILFLTDWVDGILARKYKVQTLFGSIMDTIADKTLCIILLLCLIGKQPFLSVLLLCEIAIAIINITGTLQGKKIQSQISGKIKMWFIAFTIIVSFLNTFKIIDNIFVTIGFTTTLIAEIITIIDYLKTIIKQKEIIETKSEIKNIGELKYILFDTDYYVSRL